MHHQQTEARPFSTPAPTPRAPPTASGWRERGLDYRRASKKDIGAVKRPCASDVAQAQHYHEAAGYRDSEKMMVLLLLLAYCYSVSFGGFN